MDTQTPADRDAKGGAALRTPVKIKPVIMKKVYKSKHFFHFNNDELKL